MKIKTWIKYEESYLPPRCRKLRYKECEEYVQINLSETTMDSLQLAFVDTSYSGKGNIYFYRGKLWVQEQLRKTDWVEEHGFQTPLDELIYIHEHCSTYFRFNRDREAGRETTRDSVIKKARADLRKYLLVDGVLFSVTNEPRYCIYTFGLGHNHGGTHLAVVYGYNHNITQDRYFHALHGDEAVAEANRIAQKRGDTKDVGRFKADIIVHMPELVKVNPKRKHGCGNKLLNTFDTITEAAPDALTAGLLCMAVAASM